MENADSERYDVLFAGECLEGHETAQVRAALARLFRADDATLDKLFSGTPQRIKAGIDRATALQYRKAMEAAGARAVLRPPLSAPDAPPPPAPDSTASSAAGTLSVAPTGSDVLRPEERPSVSAQAPDTSHLSVAPPGEGPGTAPSAHAAPIEAPDFDIAAVGSDLGQASDRAATAPPDTSGLSLAEGPLDLSDCAAQEAAPPNLDLDHLSVAAAGGDLVADHERQRSTVQPPDTSHLSLDDDGPAGDAGDRGDASDHLRDEDGTP